MITFLAPAERWARAFSASVKMPVEFEDDIDPQVAPWQVGGLALLEDLDLAAVDDQGVVGVVNRARIGAVGRVVLEQEGVERRLDQVVDGHHLDLGDPLDQGLERLPADPSEAIDPNPNRHRAIPPRKRPFAGTAPAGRPVSSCVNLALGPVPSTTAMGHQMRGPSTRRPIVLAEGGQGRMDGPEIDQRTPARAPTVVPQAGLHEGLAAGQADISSELGRDKPDPGAGNPERAPTDLVPGRSEKPLALVLGDRAADDDQVRVEGVDEACAGHREGPPGTGHERRTGRIAGLLTLGHGLRIEPGQRLGVGTAGAWIGRGFGRPGSRRASGRGASSQEG